VVFSYDNNKASRSGKVKGAHERNIAGVNKAFSAVIKHIRRRQEGSRIVSNLPAGNTRGQGNGVKFMNRQHAGQRTWDKGHGTRKVSSATSVGPTRDQRRRRSNKKSASNSYFSGTLGVNASGEAGMN